jgi:peptide/nickel transport system substrate-binding protein
MKLRTALLGARPCGPGPQAFAQTRGEDGNLNILYWQAVSIMNPYLSAGTKDVEASSLVLEPLARYDEQANMVPWLAAEIPTLENGGIAEDLMSVTWKLKEGLLWSDGTPVTANDVVFSYQYCTAEGTGCAQEGKFEGISNVEAVDDLTVADHLRAGDALPAGGLRGRAVADPSGRPVRGLPGAPPRPPAPRPTPSPSAPGPSAWWTSPSTTW